MAGDLAALGTGVQLAWASFAEAGGVWGTPITAEMLGRLDGAGWEL